MNDEPSLVVSVDGIGIVEGREIPVDDNAENRACELSDVPRMKVIDYGIKTTYQCGRFLVLAMLTVACLALVFYIIIDSHIKDDRVPEWAIPLLTFVIGIWVPTPTWSKKKQSIQNP